MVANASSKPQLVHQLQISIDSLVIAVSTRRVNSVLYSDKYTDFAPHPCCSSSNTRFIAVSVLCLPYLGSMWSNPIIPQYS